MKAVTPQEMREIDRICIEEFGIPGVVLMENAALKVVEEIEKHMPPLPGKRILIFAGKGNNGGDAFAVARHLFNKGAEIKVYLLAEKSSISGDAGTNLKILERSGACVKEIKASGNFDALSLEIAAADTIVDGIFGTGFNGIPEGIAAEVIGRINHSLRPVVSIDIPSGLDGMTGKIPGVCINAAKTVTFGCPKIGMLVHPGCEATGNLTVADIGIPTKVFEHIHIKAHWIEDCLVSALIPRRTADSSKGNYGKVLVICGSTGMTGAGCLCADAALRTGSGLVYLGIPSSLYSIAGKHMKEVMAVPLEDGGKGYLSAASFPQAAHAMKGKDVVALGPGLSWNEDVAGVVADILQNTEAPLVLDADALNVISSNPALLKSVRNGAVITPHSGEMARLAGISIQEVQDDRIEVSRNFARRWGVTTVLKGSKTIVAFPDGDVYINSTGNPGMATGGAGDVLTGVIASLVGQGLALTEAAVAGVYIHGLAGDRAAGVLGQHGMIAGDIVDQLPFAIWDMIKEQVMV